MVRKIALFTVAIVAIIAFGAFAASTYPGDPLPDGAINPGTWAWNSDSNQWEPDAQYAKTWNSGPVSSSGMSNKETHSFEIINHVSVAQWIEYSVSGTRKDWRILRPGIYASDSVTAFIRSNNDVVIEFYATDPEYLQDPNEGVTRTIPKWFGYSEGDNANAVEENGWYRGSDYNADEPLVIHVADSAGLHAGLSYKLWEKIEVVPSNSSSDYEGEGHVTIKLTNMKHWVDPVAGDWWYDGNTGAPSGFGTLDPGWPGPPSD